MASGWAPHLIKLLQLSSKLELSLETFWKVGAVLTDAVPFLMLRITRVGLYIDENDTLGPPSGRESAVYTTEPWLLRQYHYNLFSLFLSIFAILASFSKAVPSRARVSWRSSMQKTFADFQSIIL